MSLLGIYTISLNFLWNGPSFATVNFTLTIVDPCGSAYVVPVSPYFNFYLSDPNSSANVAPTVTSTYVEVCKQSITMNSIKSTSPDTSASVI